MGRRSDTHPQPVQVLGSDTHKIPVVAVLNPGRLPLAPHEHVKALAAMQAPVVSVEVKADVVTVGALVKYQCSCHFLCHNKILLLWLWVVTGFRPHCMNNSPGRRTAASSVPVRRLPCHGRQGKCSSCR